MLLSVAVVPQTPLLVPEIAAGAADELEPLRACVLEAVGAATSSADRVVVVAPGPAAVSFTDVRADFSPYGYGEAAPATRGVRAGSALPLGAWLLDRVAADVPREYHETSGSALALRPGARTALVVLADGTAKRDESAPGHVDVRALAFDAAVSTALAGPDTEALADLDLDRAAELWASGAPALRALGATVRADSNPTAASWRARLRYDAAPYGVGYWVAEWRREE
ncbi:hypothetical protein [Mumia quercus]|uniref:hypothetical protein n=1 Tax=Mumia quercus TaxID=2976125 RepID=UPI0021D11749|nr:hypothetical protein [Mumia quercus]